MPVPHEQSNHVGSPLLRPPLVLAVALVLVVVVAAGAGQATAPPVSAGRMLAPQPGPTSHGDARLAHNRLGALARPAAETILTASYQITLTAPGFAPQVLTVTLGSEVVWYNATDQTHVLQSGVPARTYVPVLLSQAGSPPAAPPAPREVRPSGRLVGTASFRVPLAPGESFAYTFTATGDHPYFSATAPHLTGVVHVVEPNATPTLTPTATPGTPVPTVSPSSTSTGGPSPTQSPIPSPTPTGTAATTSTAAPSPTPTDAPSATPTEAQTATPTVTATPTMVFERELAYRYAPVHHQDADDDCYLCEMLTRFDYDTDWRGDNNWDNLFNYYGPIGTAPPYVYYGVASTASHWYVLYMFYHPRDWDDSSNSNEHENDTESMLAIVYRDGSPFGMLEGIVTVAHEHFYSYVAPGSHLTAGSQDIDGTLVVDTTNGTHPYTFQEAKGHGLFAYGSGHGQDCDGIWYSPSFPYQGNENPIAPDPNLLTAGCADNNPQAYYQLLDMFDPDGLWDRRFNTETFADVGHLRGDESGGCGDGVTITCSGNAASSPWSQDDEDDGPVFGGENAYDPAHLVAVYFNIDATGLARDYESNRYAIEITLDMLYVVSNQDPPPDLSDPYFNMDFNDGGGASDHGDGIVDGDSGVQVSWIQQNSVGEWIDLAAAMPRNRFYTIKTNYQNKAPPYDPTFSIRVMDWDDDSDDEWLMNPEAYYETWATSGSFDLDFGRSRLLFSLVEAPGQ